MVQFIAKKTASDRRAFPRAQSNKPVEILRHASFRPIAATVRDISQTGMLLVTRVSIPDGERITVRPALKGAGFGAEIVAVVHRHAASDGQIQLACRFPEPLDYSVLRLFY